MLKSLRRQAPETDTSVDDSRSVSPGIESNTIDSTWFSATSVFNYLMKDPLLDWLTYHSSPDRSIDNLVLEKSSSSTKRSLAGRKSPLPTDKYNFTQYLLEQGRAFEEEIMKILTRKFGTGRIAKINGDQNPRDPKKVQATLEAMKIGTPFIHSGVIHNSANHTFGIPDLLVRSDWLKFLVQTSPISEMEAMISAPAFKQKWHYRVVDIKFTTLLLRADGERILNAGAFPAYKAQLWIYNQGLGQLQQYTPPQTYILGRRWKFVQKGIPQAGESCFDRVGSVDYDGCDIDIGSVTQAALEWLRAVRTPEAAKWDVLTYPLVRSELYPNMCNSYDYPWHGIKMDLAERTKELTRVWMVGTKNREQGLRNGISQWTDPNCTAAVLGITGKSVAPTLDAILEINRQTEISILPAAIQTNLYGWKTEAKIEFYVDFETTNGAMIPIRTTPLPIANAETLVFMIGVGYADPVTKEWRYRDFTVSTVTAAAEAKICRKVIQYIRTVSEKYGVVEPRCIHWSPAEDIMWTEAMERHPEIKPWTWEWVDLLQIFKHEPIVIAGCMSFGLKDVANAMRKHGLIESGWDVNSSCVDGQGAMVVAQKAHLKAIKRGVKFSSLPIVQDIIRYNQIDVKVLYEILTYLRKHHVAASSDQRPNKRDPSDSHSGTILKRSRRH